MRIRLIYWIMGAVLLLLFVAYCLLPKDSMDEIGMKRCGKGNHIVVGKEEREVIREIISTMAHTSLAVLPLKKGYLESLGAKLKGKVNTFEFLAVVFSDPVLVRDMKVLRKSSLKYRKFVEGISPKMLMDYEKEGFYRKAHLFAKHLGLDSKEFIAVLNGCLMVAQKGEKTAFRPMMDYLLKM